MKKIKHFVSAMLIIAVMMSTFLILTLSSQARGNYTEGYYEYDINQGEVTITNYAAPAQNGGSIYIPDTLGGYPVVRIGDNAFSYRVYVTNISVPDSVTIIDDYAFADCRALTNITLGSNITSIGDYAFAYCSKLQSITLPSTVVNIGSHVFDNCTSLFYNQYDNAYYLGNSDNQYVYLAKAKDTVSCQIHTDTRIIGYDAFENCTNLMNVKIPDNVINVGYNAFSGCSGVIQKDNGVSYVDRWIVDCDADVESVQLRDTTIGISNNAFYNCESLTSITVPDSVIFIGDSAFNGCGKLESMTLPFVGRSKFGRTEHRAEMYTLFGYIFGDTTYSGAIAAMQCYSTNLRELYYIPDTLEHITITGGTIYYGSFDECSITNVTIGNNVESIEYHALADCVNVIIDDGVTDIGNIFNGTLISITIPDSVISISTDAFSYCTQLTIYCYYGSYAYTYAIENAINYVLIYHENTETPIAPTLQSKTETTITLTPHVGYEYKVNNGNWQSSNVFTGLNINSQYTFCQRIAPTNVVEASAISSSITITTNNHIYSSTLTQGENSHYYTCVECGNKTDEFAHNYILYISNGDNTHSLSCVCGKQQLTENCHGGNATCTEKAICSICHMVYGELKEHSFNVLQQNLEQHWNKCADCSTIDTKENHVFGDDGQCTVCGYIMQIISGDETTDNTPITETNQPESDTSEITTEVSSTVGCGSAIGGTVSLIAVIGFAAACVAKKKKHE